MSVYRPHEFAKLIGKSTSKLRRWDREGKLEASRGVGNQRYYTDEDLRKALRIEDFECEEKSVVYCRVSSQSQKPDLKSKLNAMQIC